MSETEFSNDCEKALEDIDAVLGSFTTDSAFILALGQYLSDRIDSWETSPEERGGTVADLICGFGELNKEDLALYHLQREELFGINPKSIH